MTVRSILTVEAEPGVWSGHMPRHQLGKSPGNIWGWYWWRNEVKGDFRFDSKSLLQPSTGTGGWEKHTGDLQGIDVVPWKPHALKMHLTITALSLWFSSCALRLLSYYSLHKMPRVYDQRGNMGTENATKHSLDKGWGQNCLSLVREHS